MKSQGESIASAAITNYISFLCEAYILHKVGTREGDIEKVIENIIYQHLIRLGYQVYVGQLQAGEIDFVCTKPVK